MCNFFSCVVTKEGRVLWKEGVDSHSRIIKECDDYTNYVKIEYTKEGLYVDQDIIPAWFNERRREETIKEIKRIAFEEFRDRNSYRWACDIGDEDVMIDKIKSSKWAFYWALYIGNRDIMIKKTKSSKWAYWWALHIGNKDVMVEKIKSEEWAYKWAYNIGNRDVMIKKIKSSGWAYVWALCLGNKEEMNKIIYNK